MSLRLAGSTVLSPLTTPRLAANSDLSCVPKPAGPEDTGAMPGISDSQTLKEYLRRVQYAPAQNGALLELPAPTLENLILLHRLHCENIPFENLVFVHHQLKGTERPIDQDSLHKRLVLLQRGGMCQEMNALLLHNLKQLGYRGYAGLAAMVTDGSLQTVAEPFKGLVSSENLGRTQDCFGSHQIVIVNVEGHKYLCDVGAGPKCLMEPMLVRAYDDVDASGPSKQQPPADWLAAHGEYEQCGMRYRIRRGVFESAEPLSTADAMTHPELDSHVGYYLQHFIKGAWSDMYWFSLVPVTSTVLQACSDWSFRNHPLFTRNMIVSRVVPRGRISLVNFTMKTRIEGQPAEERKLQSEEERDAVLRDVFGLNLSAAPFKKQAQEASTEPARE